MSVANVVSTAGCPGKPVNVRLLCKTLHKVVNGFDLTQMVSEVLTLDAKAAPAIANTAIEQSIMNAFGLEDIM